MTYCPIVPHCETCDKDASLVTGRDVYPMHPGLWGKSMWQCPICLDYVGCHKGTHVPLGRLAGKELRALRREVHQLFDPLWLYSVNLNARSETYAELARQMSIPLDECHIGMFDESRCRIALDAISGIYKAKGKEIKKWER